MNNDNNKLCPLCSQSTENPYPEKDTHLLFGQHFTSGKYWRPTRGHKDFKLHLRLLKIFRVREVSYQENYSNLCT